MQFDRAIGLIVELVNVSRVEIGDETGLLDGSAFGYDIGSGNCSTSSQDLESALQSIAPIIGDKVWLKNGLESIVKSVLKASSVM